MQDTRPFYCLPGILVVFFSALFVCCHVPFLPWLHPTRAVILFSYAHMGAWCFFYFHFFVLISGACGGEREGQIWWGLVLLD